ncbi:aromatic ring-hydroxylating oxygenase subunit alpha [Brevibacillus reuszeri]|uniref:aromatic ring-hydroxylating oxygenase subunit alpha n=1 Tax=Brevibacillus reuszeri TaxID=54915 RepID=UPI0028A099E2|nr:aromatic ring-hydroxylating dioxygenase subunit alpha [Brevibacillus reuszeri]
MLNTKAAPFPHKFHSDPEQSYALTAPYYTDPQIFEIEREAIFFKNWIFACHAEKLRQPGSYFTYAILDQEVLITRTKDNQLKAFYNVCPHRGHQLLEGEGKKATIVCPYHAWTFQMDGELIKGRGADKVKGFDHKEHCLTPVRVEEYANLIFFNLDRDAQPAHVMYNGLEQDLKRYIPELDKLTFSHRLKFEVKANWKVVIDNFLECNHCSHTHPALCDLIDLKNYKSYIYDYYSSHTAPMGNSDGKVAYKIDPNGGNQNFIAYWLWPLTMFNANPGETALQIFHIMPTGPDTTIEYFDFYFLDKEPTEEGWAGINYMKNVLNPEDISICEAVHKGLKSKGYAGGRLIVDEERTGDISEHALHHFQGLVLQALNAR